MVPQDKEAEESRNRPYLLVRLHEGSPGLRNHIATCPNILQALDLIEVIHINVLLLRQQLGVQKLRIRPQPHGRQVEVGNNLLAPGEQDLRLAIRQRLGTLDAGVLLHLHAQLGDLTLHPRRNGIPGQQLIVGREEHHLLVLALVGNLGARLASRRPRPGHDDVRGLLDPLGGLVQQALYLLEGALGLPRGIVVGGPGPRGEDEVVVRDRRLSRRGLDPGLFGVRVDARGGADDKLERLLRVLREAGFDGVEDLGVLDEARNDGADGGYVPVEMAILFALLAFGWVAGAAMGGPV